MTELTKCPKCGSNDKAKLGPVCQAVEPDDWTPLSDEWHNTPAPEAALVSAEGEREAFENWYEANAMPLESDWFRRDFVDPEIYALDFVERSWDGWQGGYVAGRASLQSELDEVRLALDACLEWEQEYRTINHLGNIPPFPFRIAARFRKEGKG